MFHSKNILILIFNGRMLFYNKIHNKLRLFIFFIKIYMIQQIILILNKKAMSFKSPVFYNIINLYLENFSAPALGAEGWDKRLG